MKNCVFVRDIVCTIVNDIVQSIIGGAGDIPDDILGMMLARNLKLSGVLEAGDFDNDQLIGLTFNFKL